MKILTAILTVTALLLLAGCFAQNHGNDLTGLMSRVNKKYEQQIIKPEGFVLDADESQACGFVSCGDLQFLICADLDIKHRLTACHIVFDSISAAQNDSVRIFLPILFSSFTGESEDAVNAALDALSVFSGNKERLTESICETETAKYTYTPTAAGAVLSCELKQSYGTILSDRLRGGGVER